MDLYLGQGFMNVKGVHTGVQVRLGGRTDIALYGVNILHGKLVEVITWVHS